jgi:hypothetical protein
MNIKEFGALKEGDKIENPAHGGMSRGEIVECTASGVRVVWGPRHDHETPFFYSVISTTWMQWSKVNAETTSAQTSVA